MCSKHTGVECDTLTGAMSEDPPTGAPGPDAPATEPVGPEPAEAPPTEAPPTEASPTEARFKSCRWHTAPDGGGVAYCSHRDVLPFAGMTGFSADAWCPDCKFFKLRRAPRKRPAGDWQG